MSEFAIQPPTRRCTVTGRELQPGESFYSVLFESGGKIERRDYSLEAWAGPPEGALAYWRTKLPAEQDEKVRVRLVDDQTALHVFEQMSGQEVEERGARLRYVLALLLLRRKMLKIEEIRHEGGRDVLIFKRPGTDATYQVPDPGLSEREVRDIQIELDSLLQQAEVAG